MGNRFTGGELLASSNTNRSGGWMIGLGLAALAAGCSGGGAAQGSEDEVFDPEGGGSDLSGVDDGTVNDGDVVAELIMQAPAAKDFILTATIPVPPGTLTEGSMVEPLSLRLPDGRAIPTQVETVSRYPDPADGADVVRILAHVRRPVNIKTGDMIRYQVGANPHPTHDLELLEPVQDLLNVPGTITLTAKDAFGNPYSADLLAGFREDGPGARTLMDGHVARQIRTHEVLTPDQSLAGAQGTLPHMMGVHSFVTAWRGEKFLSLDLHVHNGMDGLDKDAAEDDALGDLFFQDLTLRLPKGWHLGYAIETGASGDPVKEGGWSLAPVIEANEDGTLHVLPKMAQFTRRLVIFKQSAEDKALEAARAGFQAFCAPGTNINGSENWSWWNEDTSRYYAQNHVLPRLNFVGLDTVRGDLEAKWAEFSNQLITGEGSGYPLESPRLGWAQPWGAGYGGMTGGDEIDVFAGFDVAATASRDGYRFAQLQQRCYVDRQPQALYDMAGDYTSVEDVLVTEGFGAPFADIWFNGLPNPSNDPFGFAEAPMFQETAVMAQGQAADYYDDIKHFSPIDHQHFIRYTRNLKTLAWLGGDALSMELLQAAGESYRLGFHEYNNTAYGHVQPTGLRTLQNQVAEAPGMGVGFGRGQAWGMDAALSAYAMGTAEHRAKVLPWIRKVADVLEQGQSTCTGNIMAMHINKYFGGGYLSRQAMEESFIENLLRSMDTTVFSGVEEARAQRLRERLVASVRSTFEGPYWNEAQGAPWFYVATGPADMGLGEFCMDVPSDLHSSGTNTTAYYSSFAYAYQIDPDPEFMFRATQMLGGGDLWSRLDNKGMNNMNNTAALVALCQMLGEDQP